jgi:hypothetical protein
MHAWRLRWHPAAVFGLLAIPWRHAARVDAAVMRFAETGEGWVAKIQGDPLAVRLHSPPYVALLRFEPEEQRLRVLAVFRRA